MWVRLGAQWEQMMTELKVRSEVAGSVWKVLVSVGSRVELDTPLLILESMKMEIPVEAPAVGEVLSIEVQPEEVVEEDQVLLVLGT